MRKLSNATVAAIIAIALYFTLAWGWLRILSSPSYGLDDVWRSQFIFAIGSLFSLGPIGLIKLAAFFGALKLAVAGICAIHICRSIALPVARTSELGDPGSRSYSGAGDQYRIGQSRVFGKHCRSRARAHFTASACRLCDRAVHL